MSGDYDFEPVRGLPALLPPGETLLWQGHPDWRSLAIRAFHLRKVVLYFGVLGIWVIGSAWADGEGMRGALVAAAWIPAMTLAAIAPLGLLAWLAARTTVYTITSKRIVMRIGIALPITINIPFRTIQTIGLKLHGDNSGDIPAALSRGYRLAFLVLWPHARAWHVRSPQPMMRCIPDAQRVARVLAQAISADSSQVVPPAADIVREPVLPAVRPARIPAEAA